MKVLMCNSFYYLRAGAERCFLDLSALLEAHGHEVIPFSMHHEQNLPSPYSDYFISYVDYPSLLAQRNGLTTQFKVLERVLFSRESYANISRLIEDTQPDIAHIHGIGSETSPSILPAIKRAGVPIVQTLHDYRLLCPQISFVSHGEVCERCKIHRYYNVVRHRCKRDSTAASLMAGLEITVHKAMGIYERNVDVFIAPSQFLKDKFLEYGFKSPIVHLPNFVNIEQFQPNYEPENYFVHYGRLVDYKGVFTLLEAMRSIPDSHLYIAGNGDAAEEMNRYIDEHEMTNITMLGHISSQELIPLVQRALFTVVPSEWYENYSMSVVESLACGTPVIGSRTGGIVEQVRDGLNGLLFEPGNAAELAEKMRYLIDSPDMARRMGINARQRVEEVNDPERHYEETLKIYEGLVGDKEKSPYVSVQR